MTGLVAKGICTSGPCSVIFEAGATHNGVESAKRIANAAAEAGADGIKFQICDPERLIGDRSMEFSYDVLVDRDSGKTETVCEPLYDILSRRALSKEEWRAIKRHCDSIDLAFFATVTFEYEIELVQELGCDSLKIASGDVNHWPLLRRAARTGMCIQIDTGSSTLGEIEDAVDIVRSEGNERIVIHHCPSGYPALLDRVDLRVISTLKQVFPYLVGFSDHSPGWAMDIAAIALGADVVEKTVTEDRTTRSVEHMFSLELAEMKPFVKAVRDLQTALGDSRRTMSSKERVQRLTMRRSAFLKAPVSKGQGVGEADIEFRRPGYGIAPNMYEAFRAARFVRDLPTGHMLSMSDFED